MLYGLDHQPLRLRISKCNSTVSYDILSISGSSVPDLGIIRHCNFCHKWAILLANIKQLNICVGLLDTKLSSNMWTRLIPYLIKEHIQHLAMKPIHATKHCKFCHVCICCAWICLVMSGFAMSVFVMAEFF